MTLVHGRTGATLLACFLFLSCGGGSGGGGDDGGTNPPPPPPAADLVLLNENVVEDAANTSFVSAEDAYYAMVLLTRAAEDLHHNRLDDLAFTCSQSGTVTVSATDANGNGALGSGDRVAITYDACNGVASGPYELRLTEIAFDEGVITALSGEFSIDLTYLAGEAMTLTGSGVMAFTAPSSELRWLATGFRDDFVNGSYRESLTDARVQVVINEDSSYGFAFAGTVYSDAVGGLFEVRTGPPFRGESGQWPATGLLTATGRDDSEIRYLANGGSEFATYEVDADGNGVIDDLAEGVLWPEISSGVVFGADDDATLPPPPSGPNLVSRLIALGEPAKDLAVNASRGHVYVTVPGRDELLVISASTLEVLRRIHLGSRPAGLSVSPDEDEIFVGLAASGAIAILDSDSFVETRIEVGPALESSEVYKVVETQPGILYVSTGIPDSEGHIARVDRGSGVVTQIATTAFNEIELIADPARNLLYASDGIQAAEPTVYKLDAGAPGTPAPQAFVQTTGPGQFNRLSLSPSGLLIFVSSGHVLNTEDFSPASRITPGVPWASKNGTEVFVAFGERDLVIHSATTLREIDRLETDCWKASPQPDSRFGTAQRLMESPVNGQWLILGEEVLCVVDLLNPHVAPGTGDPGVLPEPLPTTAITATSVRWANMISDSEYDSVRQRLYVSLYSAQELVTVDAENLVILERQPIGHTARGLDLSPDGSTLAIMFNDNGHVAFKDLDSGVIETQDISALLGTANGHDVQWLDDDVLFATGSPECCEEPMTAHLVRVSRSDPGASRRSAGGLGDLWGSQLTISPDRHYLYLNRPQVGLLKLDLTQPDEPIVGSRATGGVPISISPDGAQIINGDGGVLRTSDLVQTGEITGMGRYLFSVDGTTIYSGWASALDVFDPATYQASERLEPTDNCQSSRQIHSSADGRVLVTAGDNSACFWRLDEPVMTTQVKARPHDAYVCGPACMLRNHRKNAGIDVRAAPQTRQGNDAAR